ncbi:hypothetical protein L916_21458, partial [Phytophthora nicotianae]
MCWESVCSCRDKRGRIVLFRCSIFTQRGMVVVTALLKTLSYHWKLPGPRKC